MRKLPVFRPGWPHSGRLLLERFLPPLPKGVATEWLGDQTTRSAENWILDPFGASPQLAVEIARTGQRVLVAANNPINRFLLELAADPPQNEDLRAAFAELAAARTGGERLEPQIRSAYHTLCQQCSQQIEAQAFLWERDAPAPYARIYHCPHCGDNGERPTTKADQDLATGFASGGLHRARALERVAPANDPDRHNAEEALAVYLPRAVYVLFTLINKLEGLSLPDDQKHNLHGLLLHACDRANTLWPYPTARARPRQLTVPPHFKENNIWMALEEAIGFLTKAQPRIDLRIWPETPPDGPGIILFEGRLKELADSLPEIPIQAVVTAIPRPNQAFWTLSALWAGWLWGRDAVGPFKGVLRRRRYDWTWHTSALSAAFNHLSSTLDKSTPVLGLIGEAEPGFLSSALISAELTGFELAGMALRAETNQAQFEWILEGVGVLKKSTKGEVSAKDPNLVNGSKPQVDRNKIADRISTAGIRYISERGEPAVYLQLHAAALNAISQEHLLRKAAAQPIEAITGFNEAIENGLTYQTGFLRYDGSEKSLEIGQWWLREDFFDSKAGESLPLADRIEMSGINYLQKHQRAALHTFDQSLCAEYPGLLTPDPQLVLLCLDSYAEEVFPESGEWQLRPQDHAAARRNDMVAIRSNLRILGGNLGFAIEGEQPLRWLDESGKAAYAFYLFASATFGSTVLAEASTAGRPVIVLPGGRANLALYKLRRNAPLNNVIENQGWRFLKFRHIRRMIDNDLLDRDNLEEQLELDPLKDTTPQMRLL